MDLHPVQLVLRAPVAGLGMRQARVLARPLRSPGTRGQPGRGPLLRLGPLVEGLPHPGHPAVRHAQLRGGQGQYLPDELGPGRRVGHRRAERDLADLRVLHGGDAALPDLQVDQERELAGQPVAGAVLVPVGVRLFPVRPPGGRLPGVDAPDAVVGHGGAGLGPVGLAQDAVHVVPAAADGEVVRVVVARHVADRESGRSGGPAAPADQVGGERAQLVPLDRGLLVGIGVELDPALLGQYRGVVLAGPEGQT